MIIESLLSAVAALHEKGIVHRDITPNNLMFNVRNTQLQQIKIMNFGFSTIMSKDSPKKLNQILGHSNFMAPEVLKKSYDFKCDIWSIGVLTYFLLCGKLPFYKEKLEDLYFKIKEGLVIFDEDWSDISHWAKNFIV